MFKYYTLILISVFLSYSLGKTYREDMNQAETNKMDTLDQNVKNILILLSEKIPAWEEKHLEEFERNKNYQSDVLKKITDLEDNMNKKLNILHEIQTKFQEDVNLKLDTLAKNISKTFEGHIDSKCDDVKKILDSGENKTSQLNGTGNTLPDQIYNVTVTSNASAIMEKTLDEFLFPESAGLCKEVSVSGLVAPSISMDSSTLQHAQLERNSSGQLGYFAMQIAIKADERVTIHLSDKQNVSDSDVRYYIDVGRNNNQYTELQYKSKVLRRVLTPKILSSTQYRTFYINIDDGKLEFGEEGEYSPLISYYDARFRSVGFFTFNSWAGAGGASVRYDCLAPIQELPCKEESYSGSYQERPFYSVDNVTFNHVSLKRDSAGNLKYFEMHFAVQTDAYVELKMGEKIKFFDSDNRNYLNIGSDTRLDYQANVVQKLHTPNILSSKQFRAFYIRLDDGTLVFGKEGGSTPLISYYHARFRAVNYFSFTYSGSLFKFRYDCPASVKGSS